MHIISVSTIDLQQKHSRVISVQINLFTCLPIYLHTYLQL